MKKFILLMLVILFVSGCGKPQGEEYSFSDAEITDVNDWSTDTSYSCSFYIRLHDSEIVDEDVIDVEAESEYCSDFSEGDIVSGTYIDGEDLDYLTNMEY